MCTACNKIKIGKINTMNTKALTSGAISTALGLAGAAGGRELRKMIPATTLDPMYTNIAMVVAGGLLIPLFAKGKMGDYAKDLGVGVAIEAGLQLIEGQYPTFKVSGYNNSGPGLYGYNNAGPGLYGSVPNYPGTVTQASAGGL